MTPLSRALRAFLANTLVVLISAYSAAQSFAQALPDADVGLEVDPDAGLVAQALGTPEILDTPERLPFGGWRIRWRSEAGAVYRLQRWTTDELSLSGAPRWTDLATVEADSTEAVASDPTAAGARRRFYRVEKVLVHGIDLVPPVVLDIQATFAPVNNRAGAKLRVRAQDNVGVTKVIFLNGSLLLGEARRGAGDEWLFDLPLDPKVLGARFLVARALDAEGNPGHSTVFPLGLVDPDHFVPLDGTSNPIEGGIVQAVAEGQWGPVEYRPGGRNLLGQGPGFFIRFPNGVRLVREGTNQFLEFTNAIAGFGGSYPIQLKNPLAKFGGATKRLRVGPVNLVDVLDIFGQTAAGGLEVDVFSRFPLIWRAGIVDDGGIRAARFSVVSTGLPLPGTSAEYPNFAVDFTRGRGLRLPFHGDFSLPDGTTNPVTLRAGAANPLWLTLEADGRTTLEGPAQLLLPGGGFVRVFLKLADPHYRILFAADGVHAETLSSFVDLLPSNPAACVPATASDAQLDVATQCLNAFARAYVNFNGSVAALDSAAAPGSAPPEPFMTVSSVLEAWAFSELSEMAQRLPLDLVRDVVRQMGQSAAASHDLGAVLQHRLSLMRALQIISSGAATGSLEARTELEAALAEAEAAAIDRANAFDATLNIADITAAAQLLVETEALRQQLNRPAGELMTVALPRLLQRFVDRYTAALGVQPGVFSPATNPRINTLNRFAAAEEAHKLLKFLAEAQLLGVNLQASAIDEALGQIGIHLTQVASAEANAAEQRNDYPAFLLAVQDLVDIAAARELAIFPANPEVNAIVPDSSDIPALAQRLDALMQADLQKPVGERTFNNTTAEIRALLNVLREMPGNVTFAPASFQRAYNNLEALLPEATGFTALAAETNLSNLMLLIEAGTLHSELGSRFNFPVVEDWEGQRLPRVISRFRELAVERRAWSEHNATVRALINAADRLGLINDQAGRKQVLDATAQMLSTSRQVAAALLQSSQTFLGAADMALPGNIFVEDVAGSATYDAATRAFSGRFRGALFLPKFSSALVVNNASITAGGAWDINLFGTAPFPGGRVTVPHRYPLHLSFDPPGEVRLRGEARVDLESGVSFDSYLTWDEPIYAFGIAAQGLRFELGRELALSVPTLSVTQIAAFAETNRVILNEYFRDLGATLETMVGTVTNFPTIDPTSIGKPPEFEPHPIKLNLEDLNALANAILLPTGQALQNILNSTLGTAIEKAREINRDAVEARTTLLSEQTMLENQIKRLEARRRIEDAARKANQLLGSEPDIVQKSQQIIDEMQSGLEDEILLSYQLVTPAVIANLPEAFRLARVLMSYAGKAQLLSAELADLDGDGVPNATDKCPLVVNTNQGDRDNDGVGDLCDDAPDSPAISVDPVIRAIQRQGADVAVAAAMLIEAGATNLLATFGLNPTNGSVVDATKFESLREEELEFTTRLMLAITGNSDLAAVEISTNVLAGARNVNRRLGTLLFARLNAEPTNRFSLRYELITRLLETSVTADLLGDASFPISEDEIGTRMVTLLGSLSAKDRDELVERVAAKRSEAARLKDREVAREIASSSLGDDVSHFLVESPGFFFDLSEFVRVLNLPLSPAFKTSIDDEVRFRMEQLRFRTISPEFLRLRTRDAIGALSEVIDLTGWITQNLATDPNVLNDLRLTLSNMTFYVTQVAEARKEWWVATQYFDKLRRASEIYGNRLSGGLKQAFTDAEASTLAAGNRIAASIAQLAQQVQFQEIAFTLPGDIIVPHVFGNVYFNRESDELFGNFGGRVELPALGGTLEIINASIANNGEFDLNAFGSLQLAGSTVGTISIPARRPLHISHRLGEPTHFAGGLRLDLTNGMHFEGFIGLEDPVYTFGLSAGGLKFDLLDRLVLLKPTLPNAGNFTPQLASALNAYFRSLNASFESLAGLSAPLQLDPAGQRPEFRPPSVSVEFDAIETFANSVNVAIAQGAQRSHEAAYGALTNALEAITSGARELKKNLSTVVTDLDARAAERQRIAEYNEAMASLTKTLRIMATNQAAGFPGHIVQSIALEEAAAFGRTNTLALLGSPSSLRDLKTIHETAKIAVNQASVDSLLSLNEEGEVLAEIGPFLARGRTNVFAQFGLNPDGTAANPAFISSISLHLLDNHIRDLIGYSADLQALEQDGEFTHLSRAISTLATQLRRNIMFEFCTHPNMHYLDRFQYAGMLEALNAGVDASIFSYPSTIPIFDCGNGPHNMDQDNARIALEFSRAVRERELDQTRLAIDRARGQVDPFHQTFARMKLRFNFNFEQDVEEPMRRDLQGILERLDQLALETWPRERLRDGVGILQGVIDLAEAMQAIGMPGELQRLQTVTIPGLTLQFTEVAQAQKAWWELSDYTRRLLDAAGRRVGGTPTVLSNAFMTAAAASVRASDRIAQAFLALKPQFVAQEFVLPGEDLLVREVFGSVLYNKETQFLSGTFGGRVDFPSVGTNVFFSINEATLANDGSYHIDASTRTPLPFDGVMLSANVVFDYTRQFGLNALGDGQLLVPSATTTQIFNASIVYEQAAERLRVNTLAQNLNLRFTDDFVLFDAGFGFDISQSQQKGKLTAIGSAGMFGTTRPLPSIVTRTNFQLVADGITTAFSYNPNGFSVALENGTLRLPANFTTGVCPTNLASGPALALSPSNPVIVNYRENPEAVSFSGQIDFRNLGFTIPGLTNFAVEVCSARLVFPTNQFPRLTNLNATVQLPIPGQTSRVDVIDAAFSLDGYPTGTIALRDNVKIFSQGGFEFILLGTATTNCNLPSALSITRTDNGQPNLRLDGGMEFAVPPSALGADGGGRLFSRSCGFYTVTPGREPQVGLENIAIGGTMRLGGPQGLLIENGLLALDGLTNVFVASTNRPFFVTLSGFVNVPNGPRFGLQQAQFAFVGETLPRFTVAGLSIAANPDYEAAPGLLMNVTQGSIVFLDPNRPFPQVLLPDNVELGISAQINIPPGTNSIISGRVDDLRARIENGQLKTRLSGFGLGINNLEFPPLTLTGEVYLGGLDTVPQPGALAAQALPGRPPGLFFAGRVGGTLNDVGVKALVAFDMNGPIGVCLDANAGPAGIPLGPTGFLLTGVAGGVSFLNSNGDPCDFSSFYPVGADGRPIENPPPPPGSGLRAQSVRPGAVMTWAEYESYLQRAKMNQQSAQRISDSLLATHTLRNETQPRYAAAFALPENNSDFFAAALPEIPCPTGDCPPATVNILCQPHPDKSYTNRIIVKFSSIDEQTLNSFGITRQFFNNIGLTDAVSIGQAVAGPMRDGISALIPRAQPIGLVTPQQAAEINVGITNFLNNLHITLVELVRQSLAGALGNANTIYDRVKQVAYDGIPCPDATVKLTGTFSHAAVSAALSGTVGVVLSTTGSAGVVGSVNVLGVPVGRTESFVAATDNQGLPNPAFCGETLLAIGPLEFGRMKSRLECPGCVTGLLGAFGQLAGCLSDSTIRAILTRVAPQQLSKPTPQALASLNDAEKLAFVGQVFTMPPVPGLADCFVAAARSAVDSFNPSFALCGEIMPKLFGIPLSAETVEANVGTTRTNIAARFGFSPSYVIGNLMLCTSSAGLFCNPIFPALDNASFGFGLGFPDFSDAVVGGLEGRFQSPQAMANYATESFDHMLANGTFTVSYDLNPFGFKLATAQARVAMPNLTQHPARPGFTYVRPEDRGQGFPSRLEVLLAAMEKGFLAQPLWKGTADDLANVFAFGSVQSNRVRQAGLTFQRDYFPHGGMLGAGRLALPRVIVDAPPATLTTLLDPSADLFARLGAAADVIGNYILQTSEVGSLGFYVPAPNPPFFADAQGQPLTPEKLLSAIQTFDVSQLQLPNLYPKEQFFFAGYMEGRLIGIPITRADVVAVGGSPTSNAFFRVSSQIPSGSWLKSFVDNASMTFEIRESPPVPIEQFFGGLLADVEDVINTPNPQPQAVQQIVADVANSMADALPKVSLDLQVNNFRIPDPLTNLLTANASARLVAYSPRFDPASQLEGPVGEVTRRGGVAVKANMRFANLVTVSNAELAMFPSDIAVIPSMAGRFNVPNLGIPGAALHNAIFDFNSSPSPGAPFLAASGSLDALQLRNPANTNQVMLEVVPLTPGTNRLAANFSMLRPVGNALPQGSFSIDPAQIRMPILGSNLTMRVHGATTNSDFSFSSTSPWGATVSISGQLSVRDLTGLELVRIGSSGGQFSAQLTGDGMRLTSLVLSNIPTGLEVITYPNQTFSNRFVIGSTTPAQLRINGNGTFEFTASLAGNLEVPGLPTPLIKGGATVTVNESFFRMSGNLEGGLLAPGSAAQGTVTIAKNGQTTFAGSAVIPPQLFGAIEVSGVTAPEIQVALFQDGYAATNGARLRVLGVNSDLLRISPFTNRANLDFLATVTSGNFNVPNFFDVTSGRMEFRRTAGVERFEINTPTLTLMPGTPNQQVLSAPFTQLIVARDGTFYGDTGTRTINLLGGVAVTGRLEVGNEPNAGGARLLVTPGTLDFGTNNFGSTATRTLNLVNDGDVALVVTLASTSPQFVPLQSDLTIPPGQVRSVSVQFRPSANGTLTGNLNIFMNPGGAQPAVTLRGVSRSVPIFETDRQEILFGQVPRRSTATRRLVIRNIGSEPMTLTSATMSGPFTFSPSIANRLLGTNQSLEVQIAFTPAVLGSTNGQFRISATDTNVAHVIPITTANAYDELLVRVHEGGPTLRGIAMSSTNVGWAVGDNGTVLRTTKAGRTWVPVYPGFSGDFRAVAVSGDLVVIAGLQGIAGYSTNGGTSWKKITQPIVAAPTNNWQAISIALGNLTVPDPNDIGNGLVVFLAGERNGTGIVLREETGNFVQATTAPLGLNAIAFDRPPNAISGGHLIAVGDAGTIVSSLDAGTTWTNLSLNITLNLRGVSLVRALTTDTQADPWVVGEGGFFGLSSSVAARVGRIPGPTGEDFNAVSRGYIIGANGSAYSRSLLANVTPLNRENPSGAYDFNAVTAIEGHTFLAGQFGQIYYRPPAAPTGPLITVTPGNPNFGVLPVNGQRAIEIVVQNRGPATLNVSNIVAFGNSAFSVSTNRMLGIGTNSSRSFVVRYTPTSQGDDVGIVRLTHNESTTPFDIGVRGRAQLNTWNLIAAPTNGSLRDVQFVSDLTGFAITAGSVLKSTNGGKGWTRLTLNPPGTLNRLHFVNTSLGFAFGGGASPFLTCTGLCDSFIARTTDGGATWSTRNSGATTPIDDLHMVSTTTGFAVARSQTDALRVTTPGNVLRTIDGGLTWTAVTRPVPASGVFSGSAVHAVSTTTVFVGAANGQLFRSTDSGSTWTEALNAGRSIEDIQFLNSTTGWIVGVDGLFRRTTTGGASASAWLTQTPFTPVDLRRVHFITASTGWTVGDDGVNGLIFRSDDGGSSWFDEFESDITSSSQAPQSVSGRTATVAFAVGGQGVYRSSPFAFVPEPSLASQRLQDFGTVSFGGNVLGQVTLRNVGLVPVQVSSLSIEQEGSGNSFALVSAGTLAIPTNGTATVTVRYTPQTIARHHARLAIHSNSKPGVTYIDLVGEAEVFPTTVLFETQPPGLNIRLDGRDVRATRSITVVGESKVPNDVINPFEWRFGTTHQVSAPELQTRDGIEYQFQRWEPARGRDFSLIATNVPAVYRAIYVPMKATVASAASVISGFSTRRARNFSAMASGAPTDVPGGPYIRISNATLQVPAMGQVNVQGSAFLSRDGFQFTLEGDPFGVNGLFEVDAGSWRVNYTNSPERFILQAQNPGVIVLDRPVTGSSQFFLEIVTNRIVATITNTTQSPVIPGILEFGAGTRVAFTNAVTGNTRSTSLMTAGTVHALAQPGGGFAINRTFNFFASDQPFTNTIQLTGSLMSNPLLTMNTLPSSQFQVRRTSTGVYGVQLNNISLSVLGGAPTTVSAGVSQSAMNMTLGRTIGFGQLTYNAQSDPTLLWDFDDATIVARIPSGTLTVPRISQPIPFTSPWPEINTSGNFNLRIPLPTLTFDGISVSSGGTADNNFVQLSRNAGVTAFQFRDRRTFLDNTFNLRIDVNSAGTASGNFSGELVVRDFFNCEEIGVGDISLSYNSNNAPFQFRGNVRVETCVFGTHDFVVKFGSGGGEFCHLICGDNGCEQDICLR